MRFSQASGLRTAVTCPADHRTVYEKLGIEVLHDPTALGSWTDSLDAVIECSDGSLPRPLPLRGLCELSVISMCQAMKVILSSRQIRHFLVRPRRNYVSVRRFFVLPLYLESMRLKHQSPLVLFSGVRDFTQPCKLPRPPVLICLCANSLSIIDRQAPLWDGRDPQMRACLSEWMRFGVPYLLRTKELQPRTYSEVEGGLARVNQRIEVSYG